MLNITTTSTKAAIMTEDINNLITIVYAEGGAPVYASYAEPETQRDAWAKITQGHSPIAEDWDGQYGADAYNTADGVDACLRDRISETVIATWDDKHGQRVYKDHACVSITTADRNRALATAKHIGIYEDNAGKIIIIYRVGGRAQYAYADADETAARDIWRALMDGIDPISEGWDGLYGVLAQAVADEIDEYADDVGGTCSTIATWANDGLGLHIYTYRSVIM